MSNRAWIEHTYCIIKTFVTKKFSQISWILECRKSFFRKILHCSSQLRMRFSNCNVCTNVSGGKVMERNGSTEVPNKTIQSSAA